MDDAPAPTVLWVMGNLGRGGIRTMADQIVGSLGLGEERLAVLDPSAQGTAVGRVAASSAVSAGKVGGSPLGRVIGLRQVVVRNKPAAVVALGYSSGIYGWLACRLSRSDVAVLCSVRNSPEELAGPGWRRRAKRRLTLLMLERCDGVVAISSPLADELARLLPGRRIDVVPNGLRREVEAAARGGAPRSARTGEEVRAVVVGRLEQQKDPLLALDAFAAARSSRWTLRFVGEGSLEAELRARAAELGVSAAVEFAGWIPDATTEISDADILLVTSEYEGFCNVILEAMALGTPVVSVDCPSGPGQLLEGGALGVLVGERTPSAVGRAMQQTVSEVAATAERVELARTASRRYTSDATRSGYRAVIERVVDQRVERSSRRGR